MEATIYYPINYISLAQALYEYIGPHSVRSLKRVCTWFNIAFNSECTFTDERKMIDAIQHDCKKCYDKLYHIPIRERTLYTCKSGCVNYLKHVTWTTLTTEMIHVIATLPNKNAMMIEVLRSLSVKIDIIPDILAYCCNPKILRAMVRYDNIDLCLPKLCEYNMEEKISMNVAHVTDANLLHECMFLTDNNNIKNYLVSRYMDFHDDCPLGIDWVKEHANQHLIFKKYRIVDDFTEVYYRVDLPQLIISENTKEYCLKSIELAEKYDRSYMFLDGLSNEQKVNTLLHVTGKRFRKIVKSLDEGTTLDDNLLLDNLEDIKKCPMHILALDINEETKSMFYEYIYQYRLSIETAEVFSGSRAFNLLSVEYANKHNGRMYLNWLDFYDMFDLLKQYKDNNTITKVLAQQLKINAIKDKISLIHYDYNFLVCTFDDNDVERYTYYKLVLNKNTVLTRDNYHALAYQFYLQVEKLYWRDHVNFQDKWQVMSHFIEHDEFNNLQPRLVMMFVKFYANVCQVREKLLLHPMFC